MPPKEFFKIKDLEGSSLIYCAVSRHIGLDNFKQVTNLCLAMFLPFLFFVPFTLLEGRFSYNSVTLPMDGYGDILGMSFLGDTMVWPFTIIVPIILILIKYSVSVSTELLNRISWKA